MKEISVCIVDDHSLFREGIRMILSKMQGITLGMEASSGEELLARMEGILPDIILLDIEMGAMNGVETLKKLVELNPHPKVIILSMHTEPRMISNMMELGASAYLKKDASKMELENAIRCVYENGMYFNDHVSASLLSGLKSRKRRTVLPAEVSQREKEVLELICQEYTTQEIAEKLFISERTVEGHRKKLCLKLEVKNTAGLVKKAIITGLIDV